MEKKNLGDTGIQNIKNETQKQRETARKAGDKNMNKQKYNKLFHNSGSKTPQSRGTGSFAVCAGQAA